METKILLLRKILKEIMLIRKELEKSAREREK